MKDLLGAALGLLCMGLNVEAHGTIQKPWGSQRANGPIHVEQCNDIPGMKGYYGNHGGANYNNGWMRDFTNDLHKAGYGDLRYLFHKKVNNWDKFNIRTSFNPQKATTELVWRNHNHDHFIIDHHGPCAVYMVPKDGKNAKRIFNHDNCVRDYRHRALPIPSAPDLCPESGCYLEFYWLVTGVNPVPKGQLQYYYGSVFVTGNGRGSSGSSGAKQMKSGCDYAGNDIGGVHGIWNKNDCFSVCRNKQGCSKFAWNSYKGGTCWLKSGGSYKNAPGDTYCASL